MTSRRTVGAPGFDRFYIGGPRMTTAEFLAAISALSPDYFYCADAGITVTGSGVSAWLDQSGSAHTASQGTDAKRPPFSAADANLNGRASLTFDGAADNMSVATGGGWPAGTSHTIVAIMQPAIATGANDWLLDFSLGRLIVCPLGGGSADQVGASDGLAWKVFGAATTNPQTLEWHWDDPGNLVTAFRNGASIGSASYTTSRALGGTVYLGGSYTGIAYFYAGTLACVIGWASLLSAGNLTALRAAIKSYYGAGVMA